MKAEMKRDLVGRLRSKDEEERRTAMESLKGEVTASDLDWLIVPLSDESWRVRKEAIEGLSQIQPTPDLIARMVPLMDPVRELTLRNSVVEVFERMGRQAAPLVAAHLGIDQPDIRKFLVDILGNIGDPSVSGQLAALLKDPEDNIRAAAAESLAAIGDPSLGRTLQDSLESADEWVVFSLLSALARLGNEESLPYFFRYLDNPLLAKPAISGIGRLGGVVEAVRLMEMTPGLSRGAAKSALLAVGMVHRRVCLKGQREESSRIRKAVLRWADRTLAGSLAEQFSVTDNVEKRQTLLAALGLLGTDKALAAILTAVEDDAMDWDVSMALLSIGLEDIDLLVGLLGHPTDLVRRKAVQIVEHLGDAELLPDLLPMLQDASGHVRKDAARAVAALGGPDMLPWLLPLLHDEYRDVAQAAGEAIVTVGRKAQGDLEGIVEPMYKAADPSEKALLLRILGEVDAQTHLKMFLTALHDEEPILRAAAVSCLRRVRDSSAVTAVLNSLTDETPEVRAQAAMALEELKPPEALEPLRAALYDHDPWVGAAAVSAFTAQPTMNPADLRELLEGDNLMIKTAVVEALGRLAQSGRTETLNLLEEAFDRESVEIRQSIARLLGKVKGERSFDLLLRAATDQDPSVRTFAAHALSEREESRAAGILGEMAANDPEKFVRDMVRSLMEAAR